MKQLILDEKRIMMNMKLLNLFDLCKRCKAKQSKMNKVNQKIFALNCKYGDCTNSVKILNCVDYYNL